MREIKSRGKSTNTGKWVYGYFCYDWDSKGNLKPCIQSSFTEFDTSFLRTIVIPETVGQLTSLKDKNNNDIYEGDICWTYEIGIGILLRVVVFDNGSFCVTHPFCITNELRGWKQDYIEIIGNIHEHKHLLETSLA